MIGKATICLCITSLFLLASTVYPQDIWQNDIPPSALEFNNEGIIYVNKGLYEEAISRFERSLVTKKDFYSAQLNLAITQSFLYEKNGQNSLFNKALDTFRIAERIANEKNIVDSKLYSSMAWLYFLRALSTDSVNYSARSKYFLQSERLLDRSLSIDPYNKEALNTMGAIHELSGDIKKALYYYKQAADLNFEQAINNYYRLERSYD